MSETAKAMESLLLDEFKARVRNDLFFAFIVAFIIINLNQIVNLCSDYTKDQKTKEIEAIFSSSCNYFWKPFLLAILVNGLLIVTNAVKLMTISFVDKYTTKVCNYFKKGSYVPWEELNLSQTMYKDSVDRSQQILKAALAEKDKDIEEATNLLNQEKETVSKQKTELMNVKKNENMILVIDTLNFETRVFSLDETDKLLRLRNAIFDLKLFNISDPIDVKGDIIKEAAVKFTSALENTDNRNSQEELRRFIKGRFVVEIDSQYVFSELGAHLLTYVGNTVGY